MRSKDYDLLGKAITAANSWRDSTATAGAELTSVSIKMPDGEVVEFSWKQEFAEVTDPTTGASRMEVVWEGWA